MDTENNGGFFTELTVLYQLFSLMIHQHKKKHSFTETNLFDIFTSLETQHDFLYFTSNVTC